MTSYQTAHMCHVTRTNAAVSWQGDSLVFEVESNSQHRVFLCHLRSHVFKGILGYYLVWLSLELSSKPCPGRCLELLIKLSQAPNRLSGTLLRRCCLSES